MRKINKGQEAAELTQWKKSNPRGVYHNLEQTETGKATRVAVRRDCIKEQKGLCAFCCQPVEISTSHNAHIKDQSSFPQLSLEWNNIVASCESKNHCGHFQGTKELLLTPLMDSCENELQFYSSGKIKALTDDAQRTMLVLNLDEKLLRWRRKKAINDLSFSLAFHPIEDIITWDNAKLQNLISSCLKENEEGSIAPFAPILVNILRQYLT